MPLPLVSRLAGRVSRNVRFGPICGNLCRLLPQNCHKIGLQISVCSLHILCLPETRSSVNRLHLAQDLDRLLDDDARPWFLCSPCFVIRSVHELHSRQKSLPCAINFSSSSARTRSSGCGCQSPIVSSGLGFPACGRTGDRHFASCNLRR